MTLGGKYKWKANDNPPPGLYEADVSLDKVKSSSPSARLHKPFIPDHQRRVPEPTPTAYDGHLKPFGADNTNRMTWGGKYEFKVNDVPPPGYYDPEKAAGVVLARTPSAVIKEETMVDLEAASIQVWTRPTTSPDARREREAPRQYLHVPAPAATEAILRQNKQTEVVRESTQVQSQQNYEYTETRTFVTKVTSVEERDE